jgi:hypothetical protein
MANYVGQILIARILRHHLIQAKHGECRKRHVSTVWTVPLSLGILFERAA